MRKRIIFGLLFTGLLVSYYIFFIPTYTKKPFTPQAINSGLEHSNATAMTNSTAPLTNANQESMKCDPFVEICTPKQHAYFLELKFREEIQDYFDRYTEFSKSERRLKSKQYMQIITSKEEKLLMSAAEGITLKLALLKTLELNKQSYEEKAKQLIADYQNNYESAMQQQQNNPDPRFERYKQREAEVVRQVMAMQNYPNGLSRDAYMRQRLDAIRSEIYNQ